MANKYRNVFGEIEYTLGNFFVPHRVGCDGRYAILKREAWSVTDAYQIFDNIIMEQMMPFDSFIQAVRFLKENVENLI